MERAADWFLETETARRRAGAPELFESMGALEIPGFGVTLRAKADRIDRTPDGRLLIYDYKTGQVPSKDMQLRFDKQLLLEAAMVARGAFRDLGPAEAAGAAFIGLGGTPKEVAAPLDEAPAGQVWEEFLTFLRAWTDPGRGYSARPYPFQEGETGDYDHLARRGEWDRTTPFTYEDLE